ncbi:nischarin-like [Glandiceps talaboti]
MASYSDDLDDIRRTRKVMITAAEQIENFTIYNISITVNDCGWQVRHRYSEFSELHERLVTEYKLEKGLLPPKKLLGNLSKSFIEKRQKDLEHYLQTLLQKYTYLPKPLSVFLGFNKYDIHGVTETLAEELYEKGEMILAAREVYHMTPMQLYAITERLKLAIPTCVCTIFCFSPFSESGDRRQDLGHVMDFIARLKYLKVTGFEKTLGTSNRTVNQLPFDMSIFKALVQVQIDNCNCRLISGLDALKKTLNTLNIHQSTTTIRDVLLPSAHQWEAGSNEFTAIVPTWSALTTADFSHNTIDTIDESVKLMPKVEYLDLSHNSVDNLEHLQHLSCLSHVDLSHNSIQSVEALNRKLGNIKSLNLAGNQLETLSAFAKLYSLVELNVSHNQISEVIEVKHVSILPCLEKLTLIGNPVTIVTDYRTKILEIFADRASELLLDRQAATQKELDTVAVLQAIHKAREVKENQRKKASPRKKHSSHVHEAEIADAASVESDSLHQSSLQGTPGSSPPSTGQVTEGSPTSGAFRAQIESIRNLGGEQWLRMLNEMQQPSEESSPSTSIGMPFQHDDHPCSLGQSSPTMASHLSEDREDSTINPAKRSLDLYQETQHTDIDHVAAQATLTLHLPAPLQQLQCVIEAISKHSKANEFPIEDLLLTRIPIPPGEYSKSSYGNHNEIHGDDGRQPPDGESDTSEAEASTEESEPEKKEQTQSLQHYIDNMPVNLMKEFLQCLVELSEDDSALCDLSLKQGVISKFRTYLEKRLQALMPGALFEVMTTARERKSAQSTVKVTFKPGQSENVNNIAVEPDVCLPPSPPPPPPTPPSQPALDLTTLYTEDTLNEFSNQNLKANVKISDAMSNLAALRGVAIVKYFHENVALISTEFEELKLLMWCGVIPHLVPSQEIVSCVMLTSKAVYFVSDTEVNTSSRHSSGILQSWKTHRRMVSDSVVEDMQKATSKRSKTAKHEATSHSSGVILNINPDSGQKQVKCYQILQLKDLKEVFSGLFDQSFRLTGLDSQNTLSCITRDYRLTHAFLDVLISVLCFINVPTPSPEMESSSSDYDLYKASLKAWSSRENFEFIHPSKVKFVYPSEEVVNDLTFVINDNIKENRPVLEDVTILMYSLLFQLQVDYKDLAEKCEVKDESRLEPRTLVVTNSHLAVCIQDHVSYPLPDYSKVLPESPQYKITEVKTLTDVKRLVITEHDAADITLVFEKTEVIVDVTREHYSARDSPTEEDTDQPEILWTFLLQTVEERERLMKLLCKQWANLMSRELPVLVTVSDK